MIIGDGQMTEFVEIYRCVYMATVSEIEDLLREVTREPSDIRGYDYISIEQYSNVYEVTGVFTIYFESEDANVPIQETEMGHVTIVPYVHNADKQSEVSIFSDSNSHGFWSPFIMQLDRNFVAVIQDRSLPAHIPISTPMDLSIGKPGRRPDRLYDQAYEKIVAGEDIKDVYQCFLNESGIKRPDKHTRDAFKAAIKRRQNKA
jgi:hypothetical protein